MCSVSLESPSKAFGSCPAFMGGDESLDLYLAVDCGGTKAAAAICNEHGIILGRGRGGPANFTDERLQLFLKNVERATREALDEVYKHHISLDNFRRPDSAADDGDRQVHDHLLDERNAEELQGKRRNTRTVQVLPIDQATHIKAAWLGIAGVDCQADVDTLGPHLATLLHLPYPSTRLIIANDTCLLASPITDNTSIGLSSGVVVIAGTGSIVTSYRADADGTLRPLARTGGLGWLLGDEGSGFAIGKEAVRRVLDLADQERLSVQDPHEASSDLGSTEADRSKPQVKNSKAADSSVPDIPVSEHQIDIDARAVSHGRALQKAILHHWTLPSVDALLRAVYVNDNFDTTIFTSNQSDNQKDCCNSTMSLADAKLTQESSRSEASGISAAVDRKGRLASLTPLIFRLAFEQKDRLCLEIVQSQAYQLALQVRDICPRNPRAKAYFDSSSSILCLGGTLFSQEDYRSIFKKELKKMNIQFAATEYVSDPPSRGAAVLSRQMKRFQSEVR